QITRRRAAVRPVRRHACRRVHRGRVPAQVAPPKGFRQDRACLTIGATDRPYSTEVADGGAALIARYAWGDDYHEVIQRRMDALVAWMRERGGPDVDARAYVDTGPVQERVYAQYAGLGWIGRN